MCKKESQFPDEKIESLEISKDLPNGKTYFCFITVEGNRLETIMSKDQIYRRLILRS
jgi:hypothetical protein